ncbi:MAG TPA: phosphatidylglycerol lysyltransferase domain-containing protein, partial [Jatrophihabitantaceae bacterium]|nr:phosphatidylglycerol lysyltransferase domain-containing protein [Jatrophihabitantaceae bacterium]
PALGRMSRWRAAYARRAPEVLAAGAWWFGALTLAEALLPRQRDRLDDIVALLPIPLHAAATAVVAVSGLLLLRLASALRRRKRRAWIAAVGVTSVMTFAHVVDGIHVVEASISFTLLALLVDARAQFTAKSDSHSRWFAATVCAQFTAVSVGYGMAMLYMYPGHIEGSPSFWDRLTEVFASMVGAGGSITLLGDRYGDIVHGTLFAFGMVTILATAFLALRPSEPVAKLSDEDELRIRELLDTQGARDSLGYFALRRDKAVVWSATGKSAITYRVVFGVALASGDPIGDPEAWPGAVSAYRDLVAEHGWTPAVIGCSETGATVYQRELGLSALELGDEAIIDVRAFSLDGRPMRGVRQACSRVERGGYEVTVRRVADLDRTEIDQLVDVAESWRGDAVERGFSMALSRLGDPADGACVVATAHREGELQGLLHFVPWGCDGLSLDLMRRDRHAENGLNEFLIASVVEECPRLGVHRVSLNFAVFRDALERGARIGAGPISRLWRRLLLVASRWWQIETLYRFNVKFRPSWEPRFVSYPSTRDLPRIAFAALEAEAFITRPHRLKRLLGRV